MSPLNFGPYIKIAELLKVPSNFLSNVSLLLRALRSGYRINTAAYRVIAKKVHDQWYTMLPKVHQPVGLHILLKHVPEYQDLLEVPVGATSEEALEHLHKIIHRAMRRHVVTSSLKSTHLSLMRYLLICSSPTLAANHPNFRRMNHAEIDSDLAKLIIIHD